MGLEYEIIGNGKEVLVIELGIGGAFYDWLPLVEKIKDRFKVILYHRYGYGTSDVANTERTTKNIAKELNEFLNVLGIKEKFILMGHSFGGLCVQHYAKLYEQRLKAVILVDSTSFNFSKLYELNIPVMRSLISIEKMVESNKSNSNKSEEEIKNQCRGMYESIRQKFSDDIIKKYEKFLSNPILYETIANEFKNWKISSQEIKGKKQFPNIPLRVIARDNKIAEKYWVNLEIPENEAKLYEKTWRELQIELSKLNELGQLIIAENSDHEIFEDRPEVIIDTLMKL